MYIYIYICIYIYVYIYIFDIPIRLYPQKKFVIIPYCNCSTFIFLDGIWKVEEYTEKCMCRFF